MVDPITGFLAVLGLVAGAGLLGKALLKERDRRRDARVTRGV
jgi:hypothetical protein